MRPTISVCVPTYNGVNYLRECLESILTQSLDTFEVIVVDDHSNDGTFDLAQEYAARDRRVHLLANPHNLGLVGNWNRCLELAQGEWIKFVFQDDRIAPRCLEHLLQESRRDVPLTVCQRDFLFDGISAAARDSYNNHSVAMQLATLFPGAGHISAERFCNATMEHLTVNFIGEPTAVMFHRDIIRRFGRFNPDFIQISDLEYWTRIAAHTGFIAIPEVLASFRIHHRSTTAANSAGRYFRSEVIDPLLLLYQFAYDRRFAPLRQAAQRRGVNLRRMVAERAHAAWTLAVRDASDPLVGDPGPLGEWTSLAARYPKIERSAHAALHKLRDRLARHVGWRFRRENYRFHHRNDSKIPVMVIVDVEPDAFFTDRDRPVPWTGYQVVHEFLSSARAQMAAASGFAANYLWTVRMDPQVGETYGAQDWAARHYEKEFHDCQRHGDEIGIHTHAYRWDHSIGNWVVDHGNQKWVDHCVESSFTSFRSAFGNGCRSFRFGDGWMNNETMQLLEKLGAKFDLTLEPGQLPRPAVFPDKPFSGSLPDLRGIPVRPYRPQADLFTRSDPSGAGIWTIPLSAGPPNGAAGEGQAEYQTLNLGCEPETFFHIARFILTSSDRPYLTLITRSDIGVQPRLLRNMQINLSNLISHPMAPRFVFCTPPEAMKALQLEIDGA